MVRYSGRTAYVKVYTRSVLPEEYPDGLANSVHMAYSRDGIHYCPWNRNYGMLFAEAEICGNDTLRPRGIKNPCIFMAAPGRYGIAAVRALEDGSPEYRDGAEVLLWMTSDFLRFERRPSFHVNAFGPAEKIFFRCCEKRNCYEICWQDSTGIWYRKETEALPENETLSGERWTGPEKETGDCAAVGSEIVTRACLRWNPVRHIRTMVPQSIRIRRWEDLSELRAEAVYSDGSVSEKSVRWELDQVDFKKKGYCRVRGELQEEAYHFPLASGYGDPVIFRWKGSWYFIGTNDNVDDIALYARKADTVRELFAEGTRQQIILDKDEERGLVQTFWAPEFHVIGGDLYLLFAVSGKVWGPQCHMMKLKRDREILHPEDWEAPVRVRKKDGSWLAEDGITLDMTYLKAGGRSYMVWSYRRQIGTPLDTGSMLYIGEIDEATPWQLKSDPVLLSRPLYGWENVNGTINNEGPHGFVKDGTVYLGYSGGSANAYTYAVGMLTAKEDADLLDPESWEKADTPVLSYYSVKGEYGPGHHSFFVDDQGELRIAYHAEDALHHTIRCDGIRRVHFDVEGRPRFDLSAEESLDPDLSQVEIQVEVIGE